MSRERPVLQPRHEKDYGFDPLRDLFSAQKARPAHLKAINLRTLSPFQRALLVIDGTVTKFIEAYMMEPVSVAKLSQKERLLTSNHIWLEAEENTSVIAREVILKGEYTGTLYAYAASLLMPSRLPAGQQEALESERGGLGQVLLKSKMENYREVLWYGRESIDLLTPEFHHLGIHEFASRTYRIISKQRPVMLINEKFPIFKEPLPTHH